MIAPLDLAGVTIVHQAGEGRAVTHGGSYPLGGMDLTHAPLGRGVLTLRAGAGALQLSGDQADEIAPGRWRLHIDRVALVSAGPARGDCDLVSRASPPTYVSLRCRLRLGDDVEPDGGGVARGRFAFRAGALESALMLRTPVTRLLLFGLLALVPARALAWGYEGHEVIALIARGYLTPTVRAKVDALLAADTDGLTAHDMASEATWADAFRSAGHRETAPWHFVDTELDHPDLSAACFGFPAAPAGRASAGPEQDCVVDKVEEFASELRDPATSPAERLLALKYLLHFVGDLHQPLHASDNHDRGGNCVPVALGGTRTTNLHAWWDTGVVQLLGTDPAAVAAQLSAQITSVERTQWDGGDPRAWAQEAYLVAKTSAYALNTPPGCGFQAAPIGLPDAYVANAKAAAALQLERAGVRLAKLLNTTLG